MGLRITMNGVTVQGDSSLLNHSKIQASDAEITLSDVKITENSHVLENLDLEALCGELERASQELPFGTLERVSIRQLLRQGTGDKIAFAKLLFRHLVNFSEGVAASVVASLLCK